MKLASTTTILAIAFAVVALAVGYWSLRSNSTARPAAVPEPTHGASGSISPNKQPEVVIPAATPSLPSVAPREAELRRRLAAIDAAVLGSATVQAPAQVQKAESFEVTLLVQPGELQPLLAVAKLEAQEKLVAAQTKGR